MSLQGSLHGSDKMSHFQNLSSLKGIKADCYPFLDVNMAPSSGEYEKSSVC